MTKAQRHQFLTIACAMSPESLYRDGEASHREAAARLKELRREWAMLEREVGRKVTEDEIWGVFHA